MHTYTRTHAHMHTCTHECINQAPLRHMGRHPAWAARFEAHFASALREEGMLACSDGSEKSVCDCYALRSLGLGADAAGGDPALAGRQPPHSDAPAPPGGGAAPLLEP